MEGVIVLQLTPKVHKDTYLFVSELRVIYSDNSYTVGRRLLTEVIDIKEELYFKYWKF